MDNTYLIGTSGWSFDDWRGDFYPLKLPKSEWLSFYATQFGVVELNATFYRQFPKEMYQKWFENVPNNFRFVLKVPRIISHYKQLKNCESYIEKFEIASSILQSKRALMLLQLPPTLSYDPALLKNALLAFKNRQSVVVEFRNPEWYTEEIKDLLTDLNCILCCPDSPVMKLKAWLTSDIAYVRLHGRKKWFDYNYTFKELKSIALVIKKLHARGAKKIYIFFNNDYYANAPANAQTLSELLKGD